MSTVPAYPAITLPLVSTDTMYIERGAAADRGKKVTWLQMEQQLATDLGALINTQPTDSDGVTDGDFLAGENGGTGKKIPVGAFSPNINVFKMPLTGAKSLRMGDSTAAGSYVDNGITDPHNTPTAIIDSQAASQYRFTGTFRYIPSDIVSSSRSVFFAITDITDPATAALSTLLRNRVYFSISGTVTSRALVDGKTKLYTGFLASNGAAIALELRNISTGSNILYSDIYVAAAPGSYPVYLDYDFNIIT